ncbi:MAG: Uncharacterised protein [Methanobacteriota archaeon]|nr:MAG: Uncharacterised protein [Euryarchaeota archaeon]
MVFNAFDSLTNRSPVDEPMKILMPQIPGIAIGESGVPTAFFNSSTFVSVAPIKNP